MPAEVLVLMDGFTSAGVKVENQEEKTQSTVSLVVDEGVNMIVDPGVMDSQQLLVYRLKEADLEPHDINYIFITHSHIDHYRNAGMFPNAKVIEYFGVWDKNRVSERPENLTNNIRIIETPGHDYTSLTLLVKTEDGTVAICGDVFWKKDFPDVDEYAQDQRKLDESRRIVYDVADAIIPGHGPMFKITRGVYSYMKNFNRATKIISNIKQKFIKPELGVCRVCRQHFKDESEKCLCRPYLCYRCCQCDRECDLCSCGHKVQ